MTLNLQVSIWVIVIIGLLVLFWGIKKILPRRIRVFNEQCKRRFLTMFQESTIFVNKKGTPILGIPNAVIVFLYIWACGVFLISHN
jgi:hypothetical protein